MKISVEYNVLQDGTSAIEIDGLRVAYIRPIRGADGQVEVTVVCRDRHGAMLDRLPRHMIHVAAALKRAAKERIAF